MTWLAREEESLLAAQVTVGTIASWHVTNCNLQVRKTCPEAAGRLVLFQLARQLVRGRMTDAG